jgi:hypothetical protein
MYYFVADKVRVMRKPGGLGGRAMGARRAVDDPSDQPMMDAASGESARRMAAGSRPGRAVMEDLPSTCSDALRENARFRAAPGGKCGILGWKCGKNISAGGFFVGSALRDCGDFRATGVD